MKAASLILGGNLPGYFPPIANSPQGAPRAIASWKSIAVNMKKQKMKGVSKGLEVIELLSRSTDHGQQSTALPIENKVF